MPQPLFIALSLHSTPFDDDPEWSSHRRHYDLPTLSIVLRYKSLTPKHRHSTFLLRQCLLSASSFGSIKQSVVDYRIVLTVVNITSLDIVTLHRTFTNVYHSYVLYSD